MLARLGAVWHVAAVMVCCCMEKSAAHGSSAAQCTAMNQAL
jgi:hypothetical protein